MVNLLGLGWVKDRRNEDRAGTKDGGGTSARAECDGKLGRWTAASPGLANSGAAIVVRPSGPDPPQLPSATIRSFLLIRGDKAHPRSPRPLGNRSETFGSGENRGGIPSSKWATQRGDKGSDGTAAGCPGQILGTSRHCLHFPTAGRLVKKQNSEKLQ